MVKYCVYIGGKKSDETGASGSRPYWEMKKSECFKTKAAAKKFAKKKQKQGFNTRIFQREPTKQTGGTGWSAY